MNFMTFYIYSREGTGGTQVLAGATADADGFVDYGYLG